MKPNQNRAKRKMRAMEDYLAREKSVGEIAQELGVTPGAVTALAKRSGHELRGRGRKRLKEPGPRDLDLISYARKHPLAMVRSKFGLSRQRVHKILSKWVVKSATALTSFRPQKTELFRANQRKSHVVSFRITSAEFLQLENLCRENVNRSPTKSPNKVAREILREFLGQVLKKYTKIRNSPLSLFIGVFAAVYNYNRFLD